MKYWGVYINTREKPLAVFAEKHHAECFLGLYENAKVMVKEIRQVTIVVK